MPEPTCLARAAGAHFEPSQGYRDWPEIRDLVSPADRGAIAHELMMEIYKAFAAAGVEIPYSKQDVYIKEMPGNA